MKFFVADPGGTLRSVPVLEWSEWYQRFGGVPFDQGGRLVAQDAAVQRPLVVIVTEFHGIEQVGGSMFETMVFGGGSDGAQERYDTVQEARAGHQRWLECASHLGQNPQEPRGIEIEVLVHES